MPYSDILVIVLGLTLFEVVSSVDNAVVNADVLATMTPRWRRWFLFYGIFTAVFLVRGLLPLLIVYFSMPGLGLSELFFATFQSDSAVRDIMEQQTPLLLSGGGIFLVFLFLHWLFLEHKQYAFFIERHIHHRLSFWFYAIASLVLLTVGFLASGTSTNMMRGVLIGSTAFFIVAGFKEQAEQAEKRLLKGHMSDISKIIYLELIDLTFSIDGVLGAFAFTTSIPLILIGNGIGALVVRWFTIHGINTVRHYAYLKNGAMYSIGALGLIMLSEAFGGHIPVWAPPAITVAIIGLFLFLSVRELRAKHDIA